MSSLLNYTLSFPFSGTLLQTFSGFPVDCWPPWFPEFVPEIFPSFTGVFSCSGILSSKVFVNGVDNFYLQMLFCNCSTSIIVRLVKRLPRGNILDFHSSILFITPLCPTPPSQRFPNFFLSLQCLFRPIENI